MQALVRAGQDSDRALERLGWLFVTRARRSFDPGFYRLAEQCALSLEVRQAGSPEALLLRGHALHNLHRFREAESLARQLTAARGLPFDFGLLSDVLMEQGKLDEAIGACQQMIDLRPDLQSYARGAHLRWLRGDLAGAERLMRSATGAASPRDPESAAWAYSRLGLYQFQAGALAEADQSCVEALAFQTNYPPALLLRGRLGLALGEPAKAVEPLRRAVALNPLPDYQWTLAEALREAGRVPEAEEIETTLARRAATSDARTYSLFLSTRRQQAELAVRLARAELELRQDIFSHDALAWALAGAGQIDEALRESNLALAEGTRDGRLHFHSAVIAWQAGRPELAASRLRDANAFDAMLLPSERRQLSRLSAEMATSRSEAKPLIAARGDRTPYLEGKETARGDRTLYLGAKETAHGDRMPYLGGKETARGDRTPYLEAKETARGDRTPYLGGKETARGDRTPYLEQ
jgi:tetratricopeptide (TPR) repeat protein